MSNVEIIAGMIIASLIKSASEGTKTSDSDEFKKYGISFFADDEDEAFRIGLEDGRIELAREVKDALNENISPEDYFNNVMIDPKADTLAYNERGFSAKIYSEGDMGVAYLLGIEDGRLEIAQEIMEFIELM